MAREWAMGSRRNLVQSVGAKRNWTEREWQIYENLPWAVQRIADMLIRIPRFLNSAERVESEKLDRRFQFMERKMSEARQRPVERG
jgi:hypothetical protein